MTFYLADLPISSESSPQVVMTADEQTGFTITLTMSAPLTRQMAEACVYGELLKISTDAIGLFGGLTGTVTVVESKADSAKVTIVGAQVIR